MPWLIYSTLPPLTQNENSSTQNTLERAGGGRNFCSLIYWKRNLVHKHLKFIFIEREIRVEFSFEYVELKNKVSGDTNSQICM